MARRTAGYYLSAHQPIACDRIGAEGADHHDALIDEVADDVLEEVPGGSVAPVQVTLALAQLKTPDLETDTVALLHVPGPKVMVPRSRFWSIASTSGLITFADTGATWVPARAGSAPAKTPIRSRTVMIRERADGRTTTSLDRAEWLNPGGYRRNG